MSGQTIGIIGGGQLGRMMALSAKAAGFRIAVLDPTPDSPCGQVADIEITAAFNDQEALKELADVSDVVTFEFENIDADALDKLAGSINLPQGTDILRITQNRVLEKKAIEQAGVRVAPFAILENKEDLQEAVQTIGFPSVIKTATGGYDGKGQIVLRKEEDIHEASKLLQHGTCVLEQFIPFEKEISVIVTRKQNGECQTFPVAENIHVHNILHQTIVPARISKQAAENAVQMAIQLAESLEMVGTLAIEMFLNSDGDILINELAPRPHNSGHFSIEACETSQFEQHIRAICNWPLGKTALLKQVLMTNVLGEHMEPLMRHIPTEKDWKVHLYGKKEAKTGRKMGHITILGLESEEAIEQTEKTGVWNRLLTNKRKGGTT